MYGPVIAVESIAMKVDDLQLNFFQGNACVLNHRILEEICEMASKIFWPQTGIIWSLSVALAKTEGLELNDDH